MGQIFLLTMLSTTMNALYVTHYSNHKCPIAGAMIFISGIIGVYQLFHKEKNDECGDKCDRLMFTNLLPWSGV